MKFRVMSALGIAVLLSACDSGSDLDPQRQIGPDPQLPQAKNFFMPPMQVPEGTAWKQGETPKVADGLKIEKIPASL
ncbi:hypothetical protein N7568_22670, partial [Paenarthrobacter aurescens]|nr:hypothetical protein [Paenarthrobacter aurescens]